MQAYSRFSRIVSGLDADFSVCLPGEVVKRLDETDLVIVTVDASRATSLDDIEQTLGSAEDVSLLLVVDPEMLDSLRLPSHISCDFVVSTALDEEMAVRIRHLLWPSEETATSDFITVDSMAINLSTYQVLVDGQPVDFTYLEYALLAFLVTHPGHAYSRDALLSRVWGFDYYGGSRTVDVHVRRVRAKLGSELASHLTTVRGVGYMWE
ncbi:MAG: winged helix-turn-helix domain-containing protein [Coriobacteriales bacterium]|jgi:DNA-binding response OmpR family regulator